MGGREKDICCQTEYATLKEYMASREKPLGKDETWRNPQLRESDSSIMKEMLDYSRELVGVLCKAIAAWQTRQEGFGTYRQRIEELLFANCVRIKRENAYVVMDEHPLIRMQRYIEEELEKEITAQGEISNILFQEVVKTKYRNRKLFMLYNTGETYEIEDPDEHGRSYFLARRFEDVTSNIRIPAIRIWEKILNYQMEHREYGEEKKPIRIACFGELKRQEELTDICKKRKLSIKLDFYERKGAIGEYYFENKENALSGDDEVEAYDLKYSHDLLDLYNKYQIVLLMDLNCFYRQYQKTKRIEESQADVNCQWYLERIGQFEEDKDKAAIHQIIFESAGEWINAYDRRETAKYEFDANLFRRIADTPRLQTNVYLYIKHGHEVAGKNLRYSNICNDEYYDGRQMIVYKLAASDRFDEGEFIKFLDRKNEEKIAVIDFWKLLKSVSSNYYQEFIRKYFDGQIADCVIAFKKIYCVLDYSDACDTVHPVLKYSIVDKRNDPEDGIPEVIEDMVKTILDYVLGVCPAICVHRYFRDLIVQAVISNADDVSTLLFAYLLFGEKFRNVKLERMEKDSFDVKLKMEVPMIKIRKTVYTLIKRLATLRLREMDDRRWYFVSSFRKTETPELSEEVFIRTLRRIRECCGPFSYLDSRLASNCNLDRA